MERSGAGVLVPTMPCVLVTHSSLLTAAPGRATTLWLDNLSLQVSQASVASSVDAQARSSSDAGPALLDLSNARLWMTNVDVAGAGSESAALRLQGSEAFVSDGAISGFDRPALQLASSTVRMQQCSLDPLSAADAALQLQQRSGALLQGTGYIEKTSKPLADMDAKSSAFSNKTVPVRKVGKAQTSADVNAAASFRKPFLTEGNKQFRQIVKVRHIASDAVAPPIEPPCYWSCRCCIPIRQPQTLCDCRLVHSVSLIASSEKPCSGHCCHWPRCIAWHLQAPELPRHVQEQVIASDMPPPGNMNFAMPSGHQDKIVQTLVIVGAAFGGLILLLLVVLTIVCWRRHLHKRDQGSSSTTTTSTTSEKRQVSVPVQSPP